MRETFLAYYNISVATCFCSLKSFLKCMPIAVTLNIYGVAEILYFHIWHASLKRKSEKLPKGQG